MMEFENPAAFFWLLVVPLYFFLRYIKVFRPITFPLTLGDWHGKPFNWNGSAHKFFSIVASVFGSIGFICLVIAYANPVVHHQEKVYSSRGSDILYVLDTSPSMAAQDMGELTRMEAAKQAIKTLLTENTGDSVGLVEMAKETAVVVPPTLDRDLFLKKLDDIVVGEMGDGTAIGNGLVCAIMHLESSRSAKKSIVLITDGENNSGTVEPKTAARLAHVKNISLYILGIGTKGTVLLEYVDPYTNRAYSGWMTSDYDSAVMASIAAEGEGKFYEVDSLGVLAQVLDSVERNESMVQTYHIRNNDKRFFRFFIFIGAALLFLSVFLRRFALREIL
ncbi:MAG: VWA domain-containing protein [Treponema sp.]|nr:VWA domain-containing protein [Treponema sp.]MBQ2552940.1 VWA domain-containing protein [Treponema sp.]MBQ4236521.1 VWA domain-containing protein [Treponema sp.]MBQ5384495.1 VWA domain-containing protein [Treponema sp.]